MTVEVFEDYIQYGEIQIKAEGLFRPVITWEEYKKMMEEPEEKEEYI